MATTTTLEHQPAATAPEAATVAPAAPSTSTATVSAPAPVREPLFREALGMSLRAYRADKGVTLRELSAQARVSPGYLSELERGRKEVSSELLASVCLALGTSVSDVLLEAAANMSLQAMADELAHTPPAAAEV